MTGSLFSDLLTAPVDSFDGGPEDPWGGEDDGGGDSLPPPPSSTPPHDGRSASSRDGGKHAECEVCGRDIPLTPTGRVPRVRLCEDHKEQAPMRTRQTGGAGGRKPAKSARLQAIIDDLQRGAGELAGTLAPVAPVTAVYTVSQAPDAIDAIVRIAADHPKMLEGLEAAAKAVPFVTVGKFVAGMILAVSVDMGALTPTGIAAEYLRVADAAEKVGWQPKQPKQQPDQAAPTNGRVVAPPTFKL